MWVLLTCQALQFACGRARHRATRSFPMPDTAIDPIPKQGKFRRALAAVGAWLQALDYTGFDLTGNCLCGLGTLGVDRLEVGCDLRMAIHRSEHWKPEEDRQLLEFVESGKSWVLISAILKRSVRSLQDRY